ncbi:MAG: Na+/H+ antiporter NhaA [Chloroflexi bacterium]|nr:Na+/H+ antiporter NhaA [Chloroflexota bacterium]|tara:strand:+ start:3332 stop:4711 length:1380 start_codon:yes stop_codon:yes gene_type:complete
MASKYDFFEDFFDLISFRGQAKRKATLKRFTQPAQNFINTEISSGIIIIIAVLMALVIANSPLDNLYYDFVHLKIKLAIGDNVLSGDLHYWINDAAMVIFFFLVGTEIKREVLVGELADKKSLPVPLLGALGGMIVPVLIFLLILDDPAARSGWGIPMATDIAIALGAMALLGKRVPSGLKVILLAVAIVDDIGSILVIALFYTDTISLAYLVAVGCMLTLIAFSNYVGIRSIFLYSIMGLIAWICASQSGIHPTILGVILGFMTPWKSWYPTKAFPEIANKLLLRIKKSLTDSEEDIHVEKAEQDLLAMSDIAIESVSPLHRIEVILLPWSALLIVPIFAFVNAGIDVGEGALSEALSSSLTYAIAGGLLLGKPIGITIGVWLAVKSGAKFPRGVNYTNIFGMGMIAGIGFTVALFITELAYVDELFLRDAKMGILIASFLAAIFGYLMLRISSKLAE